MRGAKKTFFGDGFEIVDKRHGGKVGGYPPRVTFHRRVATDIVYVIPLSMVAGTGYLVAGLVDQSILFNLLTGPVPSVIAGSLVARVFSGRKIQFAVAIVLLVAGGKVLVCSMGKLIESDVRPKLPLTP